MFTVSLDLAEFQSTDCWNDSRLSSSLPETVMLYDGGVVVPQMLQPRIIDHSGPQTYALHPQP